MAIDRAITIADDETLSRTIRSARRRVVLLAPAISKAVAEAVVERWNTLGTEAISVILDVDPEVYRLGYGESEALAILERAATARGAALNRHYGIRVGLLVVDDLTLVFAPTPLLIEAGPRRPDTPNAIVIGTLPDQVAAELGQGPRGLRDRTVGLDRVEAGQVDGVQGDLERNPPRRFDITRLERVFNAHFEFVEFELRGTAIHRREVPIPSDLMGLAGDERARRLLKASFRIVEAEDALSGEHLEQKRRLIARAYLKPLKGYGNVVLRTDKATFVSQVDGLKKDVDAFKERVREKLQAAMDRNRAALKRALLPTVLRRPPADWRKAYGGKLERDIVERLLDQALQQAFGTADRLIGEMDVKLVFKGVTYESLTDPDFIEIAKRALPGVEALHREWEAVRGEEPRGSV
jgi:hypothetical protein